MPDLSVIIVNWNTREMLANCLSAVIKHAGCLDVEMVVIDNASTDGSQAMVRERFHQVVLIENKTNVGFARANNQGMKVARAPFMLLLNSDALVTDGALQSLLDLAARKSKAGIIGAHLNNPDGTFQSSYTRFPNLRREFLILTGLGRLFFGPWYPSAGPEEDRRGPQKVDYVDGACLLVRADAFRKAGGLDESFFMYAEEVDWCYSLRQQGWETWYQPDAWITHFGGLSSWNRRTAREADLYRSRVRFFRKHYSRLSTFALKLLIYCITTVKIFAHSLLRLVSRDRRGRTVVGLSDLHTALRNI